MARINPSNFYETVKAKQADLKNHANRTYQAGVLRKLARLYGLTGADIDDHFAAVTEGDPLEHFKQCVQIPELDLIYIEKVSGVAALSLLTNTKHTRAWTRFKELRQSTGRESLALVLPVTGLGDCVISNLGGPKRTFGRPRTVMPSMNADLHDVEIIGLDLFILDRQPDKQQED